MEKDNKKKSEYFQSVARRFFALRGAPFFLSSKELALIAGWEEMGIPLRVVIEGMTRSFEGCRRRRGGRKKMSSLSFCHHQVLKAFDEEKERRVGRKRDLAGKEEKREAAKNEVEKFLKGLPPELNYLQEPYSRALRILAQGHLDEEGIERIDEEVEELLWMHAPEEEKAGVKAEVGKEYGCQEEKEAVELGKIKLVKGLREKHRIPHISLYYY
jgi:hypothetical protein